jgi:hypothetical protein
VNNQSKKTKMTQSKTQTTKSQELRTSPNGTPLRTLKMSWLHFMDSFVPAFQLLSNRPSNPNSGKLKYAIKRSIEPIQKLATKYNRAKSELFEDFAKKDANGNPQYDEAKNYLFETPELRKGCLKKLDELNDTMIEVVVYPISMVHIESSTPLTIQHEIALNGFIEEWNEND